MLNLFYFYLIEILFKDKKIMQDKVKVCFIFQRYIFLILQFQN